MTGDYDAWTQRSRPGPWPPPAGSDRGLLRALASATRHGHITWRHMWPGEWHCTDAGHLELTAPLPWRRWQLTVLDATCPPGGPGRTVRPVASWTRTGKAMAALLTAVETAAATGPVVRLAPRQDSAS